MHNLTCVSLVYRAFNRTRICVPQALFLVTDSVPAALIGGPAVSSPSAIPLTQRTLSQTPTTAKSTTTATPTPTTRVQTTSAATTRKPQAAQKVTASVIPPLAHKQQLQQCPASTKLWNFRRCRRCDSDADCRPSQTCCQVVKGGRQLRRGRCIHSAFIDLFDDAY